MTFALAVQYRDFELRKEFLTRIGQEILKNAEKGYRLTMRAWTVACNDFKKFWRNKVPNPIRIGLLGHAMMDMYQHGEEAQNAMLDAVVHKSSAYAGSTSSVL